MAGPADMNEEAKTEADAESDAEMIDPRVFIKPLASDQLGMFEPLSGLMLLNVSRAEMIELTGRWMAGHPTEFDVTVLRTINHEAYHFAQVAASGYGFHRQCRLFMVLNQSEPLPQLQNDPEFVALAETMRTQAGDDPELKLRYARMMAMLAGHQQLAVMESRAAAGDNSLMGAMLPDYFAHLKGLADGERVANAEGLSVLGILEGSAVVHTNLLMHPNEDALPFIEAELTTLPPVYRELFDLTLARVDGRALELMLPAVTLALRYAHPHNAYLPLLALLAESALGEGLEHGRNLGKALPEIAGAGPLFGTANDLRKRHDGYRLYDTILDKLTTREWGIDAYDFLAKPAAMHAIGSFPLGIVTTDGYMGSMEKNELAARMALMGVVLRTQSRRRLEREFREFQVDWARGIFSRLVGDVAPPPVT